MSRITVTISLLALLAPISATVRADQCFCLSDPDDAILRGCEAKGATILCTDPVTAKKSVPKISSSWKRIEDGADRCVVCRADPKETSRELPRGDDDAKKERQ